MPTTTYAHYRDVPDSDWRWPSFSPAEIASRGEGAIRINTEANMERSFIGGSQRVKCERLLQRLSRGLRCVRCERPVRRRLRVGQADGKKSGEPAV